MGFKLIAGNRPQLWLGSFDIFPQDKFRHGISTKHGGCSLGQYASLNLGLHVEDEAEKVIANRRIFCEALGMDSEKTTTCQQVHGSNVAVITEKQAGAGFLDFSQSIPDTDALITNVPGVPLMLFFADCTPILLADPVHKAVGLAHGGWKGTFGSIVAKAVEAMQDNYGSRPEDILAAIGPSIGSCCYQIGDDLAEKFRAKFPEFQAEILSCPEGNIHLDLQRTNTLQLLQAGLKPEHIENAHVCTCCHSEQFFSYRADKGKTGRIAAIISVK